MRGPGKRRAAQQQTPITQAQNNPSASAGAARSQETGALTLLADEAAGMNVTDSAEVVRQFLTGEEGKSLMTNIFSEIVGRIGNDVLKPMMKECFGPEVLKPMVVQCVKDVASSMSRDSNVSGNGFEDEIIPKLIEMCGNYGVWTPSNPPKSKSTTLEWVVDILRQMKDNAELAQIVRLSIPDEQELVGFAESLLKRHQGLGKPIRDSCNNGRDARRVILFSQLDIHFGNLSMGNRLPAFKAFKDGVESCLTRRAQGVFVPKDFEVWWFNTFNVKVGDETSEREFVDRLTQEQITVSAKKQTRKRVARENDAGDVPRNDRQPAEREEDPLSFYNDE